MTPAFEWQPGDVVAFWGRSALSRTISLVTAPQFGLRPGPSHVAIVCRLRPWGDLLVESTTLNPLYDLFRGKRVDGCQAHPPWDVIERFDGRVELYRLKPLWSLSTSEAELLARVLITHFVVAGVGYDTQSAILSGAPFLGRLIGWLDGDRTALETVFCSELIAAALQRLGRLPVVSPSLTTPASLIRRMVRRGIYERVPLPRCPRLSS